MRDLHSHILPGVDDGSKNLGLTEKMLLSAYNNGVTDIMLTPHYIKDSRYISNKKNNSNILENVKKIANKYNINVYLGNEVYIDEQMYDLYKSLEISTLNNSRYMLIEIPMHSKMNNVRSLFYELIINGITPILAHPERYEYYYNNLDFFLDLRNLGVLMQINYPSLVGVYGKKAKKMAKKLLKANVISFIGSDIHHETEQKYELINKSLKKLKRIVGEKKFLELTEENFMHVVNNEEI